MTPEEAFKSDPLKRQAVAEMLADPVILEAFEIVKDIMEPKTGTQAEAAPAMAAAFYHQVAGAGKFRQKLRELSREPVERKTLRGKTQAKTIDDIPLNYR